MTQKIGPKEMAQRELQKGKLSRAHQMMLDDGCPKELLRTGSGPKRKPATKPDQGVALAPPLSVQKAIAADLADERYPDRLGSGHDPGNDADRAHHRAWRLVLRP